MLIVLLGPVLIEILSRVNKDIMRLSHIESRSSVKFMQ